MSSPVQAPQIVNEASSDASRVLDILGRALHASRSEWLFLRELRVGADRRNNGAQRLDGFALNCLPHMRMKRICYEVKCSRSDYLMELRHPLKRRMGMRYSNEFYFVTPANLLKLAEVPAECGLIEVGTAAVEEWRELIQRQAGFFAYDATSGEYCVTTIPAPWRDTPGPTWELVAAMLRHQRRELEDRPAVPRAQQKLPFG
jgi:hypothetical protein